MTASSQFSEDDLIALHLHELSPRRARALRNAIAADPLLAAEAEAIAFTLRAFDPQSPTPPIDAALLDRTWQSLRPSLAIHSPAPRFHAWRTPLATAAGLSLATAAAILGFALWSTTHLHTPTPTQNQTAAADFSPTAQTPTPPQSTPSPLDATPPAIAPQHETSSLQASLHANRIPSTQPGSSNTPQRNPQPTPQAPIPAPPTAANLTLPTHPPLEPQQPLTNDALALNHTPQIQPASTSPRPSTIHNRQHDSQSDISFSGFGIFAAAHTSGSSSTSGSSFRSQSLVPSSGVLIAYHHQFSPRVGYEVAVAHTRPIFQYAYNITSNTSTGTFTQPQNGFIGTNMEEASASWAISGPHTHRLRSHISAGPALLAFLPTGDTQSDSYGFRPAALAGAAINLRVKRHWSLRAGYRALFFKTPDFRYTGGTIPVTTRYALASEPSLGLTYDFDLPRP